MSYRRIELLRAGWGAALLVGPDQVLRNVHNVQVDTKSLTVARILGGRQLVQAALSGSDPTPEILAMGVWVDAAHCASALALAAFARNRARAGLVDAVIAATWAVFGYYDLRSARFDEAAHDRNRDAMARWLLVRLPLGASLGAWAADSRTPVGRNRPV